jgi:hypothetical protein
MLYRRTDSLVRSSQVLRVEHAKRNRDRWGHDSHDALFQVWPKNRNPTVAAKKKLWVAHGGWAAWTRCAIVPHLLQGRCCIVHDATVAGGMTPLVHLTSTTRELARLEVKFSGYRLSRQIGL